MKIHTVYVTSEVIDYIYSTSKITLSSDLFNIDLLSYDINGYFLFKSESKSAVIRHLGNNQFVKINSIKNLAPDFPITPKDVKQTAFVDCLFDPNISVSCAIGAAGTGKTTLAMAYALQRFFKDGQDIILSKPTTMVSKSDAFGPIPGDIDEKYAPYLSSYEIIFKKLSGAKGESYIQMAKQKKQIQYVPIELARGCTFENCTFILDEAQNLNWHEFNTIVSRIGENSKLIILGDLNQIDINLTKKETGLYKFLNAPPTKQSPIVSSIELTQQYRSKITQLIFEVNEYITNS